jgi:glycosyltransferase involved in cell wall biosynthesis
MNDPLKSYRRSFRAWIKSRALKRELFRYRSLFRAKSMTVPDELAIRQAMKSKYPAMTRKARGTLKILAIYHDYNWENVSLLPALKKFGSVWHYDWVEKFDHRNQKKWLQSIKAKMNRDLIERIKRHTEGENVDVIFSYLTGEIVFPDTIEKLSLLGVPMVNMCLNDKEAFIGKTRRGQDMGSRDICRFFDLSWTSTVEALEKYCVEGARPIYLPEGANPEIHKPYDLLKTIDVSFVGQCYGSRPEIIEKIRNHGIAVETYGYGWPNGPLPIDDMVRTYSRSKINLGFAEVDGYNRTYCLKGRDFEIPMSGGLYLTQYHPELEEWYNLEKEIVVYGNVDDLVGKIIFLLSNPNEAERIRKNGLKRARGEHTWEMRFEKVFSLLGLI